MTCLVTQSCPTLCNPLHCSPPGSSVHGISHPRILGWVAMSFSRTSSWPRDQTCISRVSWVADRLFTHWVIREAVLNTEHEGIHLVQRAVQIRAKPASGSTWHSQLPGQGVVTELHTIEFYTVELCGHIANCDFSAIIFHK